MVDPAEREGIFRGGGQMGALMRATDWSATPLGPVERWPQSLRTAVSLVLDSRFPMYLAWGPEYVQLYNDGYRPILGSSKHPAAMGNRASVTFAESWHIIGPMFDDVRRGGAIGSEDWMLPLDRHGYLEECFFTFSYSPIRDESGGVGGVHVTVTETTGRVLGQRRLRLLHQLSEEMVGKTAPLEVCERAMRLLERNLADVPFALLYLLEEDGTAVLAAHMGLADRPEARPARIGLRSEASGWPLARVLEHGEPETLSDLEDRFGRLSGGAWPEPTRQAMVHLVGRAGRERPHGFLVTGVSPRRALDQDYREFFSLMAGHVASALGSARALADERRRREELAELDRLKTIFFNNVSHELRTPLTLMLGPAEDALASPEQLAPAERERWDLVQRNALRLQKLVNALLDLSRIEAGRVEPSFEPVELGKLTTELASMFATAFERAGISLRVIVDDADARTSVDRDMWEKIVLNLLSNGLKCTLRGEVEVRLRHLEGSVDLTVRDTGVGIPAEQLPRVFDRFHRVRNARARTQEGTGIGLALVQELVRMHQGRIHVRSVSGEGTEFTVSIPRRQTQERPAAAAERTSERAAAPYVQEALQWLPAAPEMLGSSSLFPVPAAPARAARILVVDDNRDMRDYLVRLLAERWNVEAVADGLTALTSARAHPPDLVVSDVMLPGIDGIQLVQRLRADEATRSIPVILVSARAGEESSAEGLAAGANDYLPKPFSARDLLLRVASQLGTARAAAEARNAAERERARLYQHFIEAPFPIAVLRGPTHVFELANNSALQVWARGPEILGRSLAEVFPELRDQPFPGYLDRVLATGQAYEGKEELARLRRGGALEDVYFNFVYSPLHDGSGAVEGILLCGFEVTTQVVARRAVEQLAERERQARAAAEEADRRKDEFLAMLSHELRNPLAAMSTALALANHLEIADPRLVRFRDVCRRQVQTLVRMVDDLLDVTRITRGKVELRLEPVDLAEVIQNAVLTARHVIEERGHELTVSIGSGPLRMQGDPTRLEQTICNLLVNAAKYTPPRGRVWVSARQEDGAGGRRIVVSVKDSGRGITGSMLKQIFDPFVQVHSSLARSEGGLGIGLTLVRRLVEMHGGTVVAYSDGEGRGSEFVLQLPAAEAVATPGHPPRATARLSLAGERRRVLVVEDSADLREGLKEALELAGHEVFTAADGLAGVQAAKDAAPEVAIIDVGLPILDGFEVARRVRAHGGAEAPYLVALTGYGDPVTRQRAREAGFDEHLTKPVDVGDLERVIVRVPAGRAAS